MAIGSFPEPSPTAASRVLFSKEVDVGGKTVPLIGSGLFEYIRWDVYSAAFYAPEGVSTVDEALGAGPKMLALHYHRTLSKKDFVGSSRKILAKIPDLDLEAIDAELTIIFNAFEAVEKGDVYTLAYVPGSGTTLALNGLPKATIPGDAFQRAYFAIWLSEDGMSQELSRQLRGAEKEKRKATNPRRRPGR